MTFDMVMTAIAYALFLFVWLPWQVVKHRRITAVHKTMANAYRFYLRYRAVQGLTKNLRMMRDL